MTARAYVAAAARSRRYDWGPPVRQHDRDQSADNRGDAAGRLVNCWIRDADTETPMVEGRPGFSQMGAQLGSVGARAVQRVAQFTKVNGTEYTVAVVGGEVYTYDWGGDAWTKVLTTANLAGSAITLSASAKVYAVNFADLLVISDGVNTPFAWDGTAGAGLTKLTNAPVLYGAPWVYYGQLFGIKSTERTTIVWSEPATPNTGYEAGGYNNAWTLRQTNAAPFFAGAATNDAIYLFRQNSVTLVTGEVTTDFRSSGTREAVSEHVGCRSPAAVMVVDQDVYFLSSDRRVMRARGVALEEVGIGARNALTALNPLKFERAEIALWDGEPQGERVVVGVAETGYDEPNAYVVCNPKTGLCEGVWRGWQSTVLATAKNAAGERRLVHGGGSTSATVDEGYCYWHDVPTGNVWDDGFAAGAVAIQHTVRTGHLGATVALDKHWTRLDTTLRIPTTLTGVSVTVATPRGTWPLATPLSVTSSGSDARWDVSLWDQATWGTELGERHLPAGLRQVTGRWLEVELTHAELGERWQLQQVSAVAAPLDERPSTY